MNNSKMLFTDFVNSINIEESNDEIESISYMAFEEVFHLSKAEILTGKKIAESKPEVLHQIIQRINQHEPIQYILGRASFYGRFFSVTPAVLIPRPETEELVLNVKEHLEQMVSQPVHVLDVGTGSGCIAITLALELKHARVSAFDVSEQALEVASLNAAHLKATVEFNLHNILTTEIPFKTDVIVSNPPYIPEREKEKMPLNVKHFEPELALFVPDDDALIFYKRLVARAKHSMNNGGLLAVEIHEGSGNEIERLFTMQGLKNVEVVRDIFGKDRIVKGIVSS